MVFVLPSLSAYLHYANPIRTMFLHPNISRAAWLLLVLALCTASAPRPAAHSFVLANQTGVNVDKLFVSPHGANAWGDDVLGRAALAHGESATITFNRSEGTTVWDIRIADNEGTTLDWEQGFDLTAVKKITLHYDAASGKATATTE